MRKEVKKFNIRETIPFKILIVFVILLIILLFVWVGLKISERAEEKELEEELGGELGILKWGLPWNTVILTAVNYNINNETIEINVNWNEGSGDLHAILFQFERGDLDCNHTITTDLPQMLGENKTYVIGIQDTVCQGANFTDVSGVVVTPGVDIIINQIQDFSNMTLNKNENTTNILELYNYFNCSVEYLMFFWALAEENITAILNISINETFEEINRSALVSFYPDYNWVGEERINITVSCADEFISNYFYIIVSETITNNPPTFNNTACDDLEWEVNTDYKLNMRKCWYDSDGDSLTGFRYANSSSSNKNLSISQNVDNLTLSPDNRWVGTGYFYIYASDSKDESSARVDFEVENSSATSGTTGSSGSSSSFGGGSGNTTNATATNDPKIILSSPSDNEVYIFPGNKTFSITAEKYNDVKWYLNGMLIAGAEDRLTYEFVDLKEGDIVKVEVINGTRVDSKTWNIKIQEDETINEGVFDVGSVIFYLIIAVICIIILLIVWLIIIERNSRTKKSIGFGVSGPESNVKIVGGRDSGLDSLNIPG